MMKWLYKMEYKYKNNAIPNLMKIITIGQLAVFVVNFLFPGLGLLNWMSLTRAGLFSGQIWRLVTFLLVPPITSPLFVLFSLYFYYFIGGALENAWGSFMFNAYYFIGALGAVIAALVSGYGTNYYLNMSLFFAFAILYPNFEFMLFFVLPVKVKWLALLDAALFVWGLIVGPWSNRAAIIASFINLIIFFGGTLLKMIKQQQAYAKTRRNFREQSARWNGGNRYS